ncbi:MAG TPA: ABC transporter permease [Chitinophagaceae bacterium]|nr:ABC transporter permease [Chitinophagaceae bacterium]
MAESYNQLRAMMAIAKGSLKAIFRSPSAVVFTLAFPLIFILVFGFVGHGKITVTAGVARTCDTLNPVYRSLSGIQIVKLVHYRSDSLMKDDLTKGRITAILNITDGSGTAGSPHYQVGITTSAAAADRIGMFEDIIDHVIDHINTRMFPGRATIAVVPAPTIVPGRQYKEIDFILPGMLGFSLLSAGVFGTAFIFFSLRQTLVLKRFFATPINRIYIVLGEAIARLVFQIMGAVVIIGVGYFAFNYTLIHGLTTLLEMLLLSAYGLIVFMGFGFIVSSLSKTESTIPPMANLVTLPQFLLAGTFFPVDVFPKWLQPLCKILPLTYLNDAFRKIAFEGLNFSQILPQLLVLTIWGLIVYAVTIKVFRWE